MTPFHVSKSDFPEDSLEIIRAAHSALTQMDKQVVKGWDYWKVVGAGLVEIRRLAMSRGMTNAPFGRGYTAAYAPLLTASKLDQRIRDKGDRQKLVAVMDNLVAVEAWLETLSKEDRRRWTHPTTIYKKWQESLRPPGDYKDKDKPKPKEAIEEALTDKVDVLRKENAQLKIEAGQRCEVDLVRSEMTELERYLRARILSEHRARRIRDVLNELYPVERVLPKVPVTLRDDEDEDDI